MYGTHFDVSTDMGGTACLGVITLRGGIVNAKIESSAGGGHGALLYGGQTTQITLTAGDTSKSVGSNGSYDERHLRHLVGTSQNRAGVGQHR